MHELSLATEIIDLVRPNIPEGQALQKVHLTVGLLAGVCTDSLTFCFTEMARMEGYPEAVLEITSAPARYRCHSCSTDYETDTVESGCPECSSTERIMLGGAEFTVDFIEV